MSNDRAAVSTSGKPEQMGKARTGGCRVVFCGQMSFATNTQTKTPYSSFTCTSYRQFGKKGGTCTSHYTCYDILYAYVLSRIQYWASQAELGEEQLLQQFINSSDKKRIAAAKKKTGELAKAEKRKAAEDNSKAKYKWLIENSPNS